VNFDRSEGLVGHRLDVWPQAQWAQRKIYGFFVPKASLRYTSYRLDNNDPDTADDPSRTIPLFSLDSGVFLEREFHWSGQDMVQTLEPRLFYLYVPYRDQSNLLVDENGVQRTFDSGATTLSWQQLFRENRFSGADLVGDANQLSAAVTSRVLDAQGRERLAAGLGQIFYFRDREVILPGQSVQTDTRSDVVLQLRSRLTQATSGQLDLFYNDRERKTRKGAFRFRFQPERDKMLNVSYRYERNANNFDLDTINQADATLLWPLHRRWDFVGHWHYSFLDDITLEHFTGLEYKSCCWAVRAVYRRYLTDTDETEEPQYNDTVLVQFELKGLANVGSDINRVFTEGILEN
jgi:LPS-assembly protein